MGTTSARSRTTRWALGVAIASAVALAVGGPVRVARADAPTLRWKFTAGESLRYQMEQKAVTEVKTNALNNKTTVNQTMEITRAIKSVGPSGIAEVVQTVDRIKTKIESPFGVVEYDTSDPKAPGGAMVAGFVPLLKAMIGAAFRYKINPQGELSDIQVPGSLIEAIKEAGPAVGNGGMFSEEGFKTMIAEMSFVLPARPVDQPWTRQVKSPTPIGTLVLDRTYKYEGMEGDDARIGLEVKASFEPAPNSNSEVKLGQHEGKGLFLFNVKAGRVVSSNVSEKIEILLTINKAAFTQVRDTVTSMKLLEAKAGEAK